jgi:hypothetical protein
VKSNANGSTLYLAEGQEVPRELLNVEGLELVGPGSGEVADESAAVAEAMAVAEPKRRGRPPGSRTKVV